MCRKITLLIGIITLAGCLPMMGIVHAATIKAASCSQAHVQEAINAASAGDTVVVPAGRCTWNSSVNIPTGVTLRGAGTGNTVISSSDLINISLNDNSWIEGFEFSNGIAYPGKGAQNWVVKDCNFTNSTPTSVYIDGRGKTEQPTGVYHHCEFSRFRLVVDSYANATDGSTDWYYPDDLGGIDHVTYIEGCTFWTQGSSTGSVGDGNRGGQMVFRFNTSYGHLQTHGAREDAARGMRKIEWYRNKFIRDRGAETSKVIALWIRGGTALMFDNDCDGDEDDCRYVFDSERVYGSHGQCADNNPFDTDPHPKTGSSFMCRDVLGTGQDTSLSPDPKDGALNAQTYSPAYFWNNLYEGSTGRVLAVNSAENYIIEGREYFLDASLDGSFGNGGVTTGLWANRPTCNASKKYHGYWATDKGGDWNSTDEWNGDDGALYVCDGIDTWNLYYTPAPYPHPLVQARGSREAPLPPTGLTVKER